MACDGKDLDHQPTGEGRIHKNEVEKLLGLCQVLHRVRSYELTCPRVQSFAIPIQRMNGLGGVFDEHHSCCSPGGRFETQRAASSEKIQTDFVIEPLPDPIEQRFPDSIPRRTQARGVGKFDPAPAELAGNDSYAVIAARARLNAWLRMSLR